jgi:MYXO-CTERM domain-containing protein
MAAQIWSRVELTPGNRVWAGIDYGAPSDTSLVSPPLDVSATEALILTFDHAHSFENSMNVNWDGAVIEVSSDAGQTWTDISSFGDPGYGGTIGDPANMAMNVLKGRQGYVATNPSYPATDKVTVNLGTKLASATVQIRFRIGTDDAQGDVGWQLDNIGLQGITNKPFASLVADTGTCSTSTTASVSASSGAGGAASGPSGSTSSGGTGGDGFGHVQADSGCGCGVAGDATGTGVAAQLLALSALLVRRRRRTLTPR